jgi:hypothetical protein
LSDIIAVISLIVSIVAATTGGLSARHARKLAQINERMLSASLRPELHVEEWKREDGGNAEICAVSIINVGNGPAFNLKPGFTATDAPDADDLWIGARSRSVLGKGERAEVGWKAALTWPPQGSPDFKPDPPSPLGNAGIRKQVTFTITYCDADGEQYKLTIDLLVASNENYQNAPRLEEKVAPGIFILRRHSARV